MRMLPLATAATLAFAGLPAMAQDLVFTLVNNSSLNLVELYVSPHSADDWGDNILTVDALSAGAKGNVTIADGDTTCDYDLRFVMDNGATAEGTQAWGTIAAGTLMVIAPLLITFLIFQKRFISSFVTSGIK